MSEPLFKPVSDGEVLRLPVASGQQHKFGDAVLIPNVSAQRSLEPGDTIDHPPRHSQTERACAICGVVKVTVHGSNGQHWREWRLPGSIRQFATLVAPRCEVLPQ